MLVRVWFDIMPNAALLPQGLDPSTDAACAEVEEALGSSAMLAPEPEPSVLLVRSMPPATTTAADAAAHTTTPAHTHTLTPTPANMTALYLCPAAERMRWGGCDRRQSWAWGTCGIPPRPLRRCAPAGQLAPCAPPPASLIDLIPIPYNDRSINHHGVRRYHDIFPGFPSTTRTCFRARISERQATVTSIVCRISKTRGFECPDPVRRPFFFQFYTFSFIISVLSVIPV